jgi:hypothetical protein
VGEQSGIAGFFGRFYLPVAVVSRAFRLTGTSACLSFFMLYQRSGMADFFLCGVSLLADTFSVENQPCLAALP